MCPGHDISFPLENQLILELGWRTLVGGITTGYQSGHSEREEMQDLN
jgi:hypothetical protein